MGRGLGEPLGPQSSEHDGDASVSLVRASNWCQRHRTGGRPTEPPGDRSQPGSPHAFGARLGRDRRRCVGMMMAMVAAARIRGPVVWVLMRYVVPPLRGGEERLFTTSLISPQWVRWVSHAALGMTLGAVTAVARRRLAPSR